MAKRFLSRLYLVISEDACRGRNMVWVIERAIKGGVDLVQIREKSRDFKTLKSLCITTKKLLDKYSVPLIINDNLDMAISCCASGIHVGNNDVSPSFIREKWSTDTLVGYSIEDLSQLAGKEVLCADYLAVSPVFKSKTKLDTRHNWGLEGISTIKKLTDKPLVAIGDLNADNTYGVIRAGADCIAVVSAICGADNPEKAAAEIRNQIENAI
jgi:thiamine-phosphate pyrophosphorylase